MDTEIDPVRILYAVGVLLGVIATFYFGFRLLEDLSPTTTSATLFLGFVVFLFAGLYARNGTLDTVFYALSAGSYLVFVAYVLETYDLGDGGVFALLAGSSALFVALGYASSKGVFEVDRTKAVVGIAVVLVLVVGLLVFDATGAQPGYSQEFRDTVDIPDGIDEQVVVGETVAKNPFVLSRRADPPSVTGCLYTPERRHVSLRRDVPYSLVLGGGETRGFDVTVAGSSFFDHEDGELTKLMPNREGIPVEVSEACPETADEPKLVVVTGEETTARPVPP